MSDDLMNGSVMVMGGGIAGIQSTIDLADAGFLVHLVEKSSAIGGVMSELDKTFPTNDCSMCILSPKLVDVGRHANVKLYTCTTIEKIEGSAGNFQITINKKPRYIDADKCTACGDCSKVCPVVLPDKYNMNMSEKKAVYKLFPQAIPSSFTIEKHDKAPCTMACPAHLNVQGYVAMVKQGKYKEAVEIIMEKLPFPGVLGRVCPHKCEESCRRKEVDKAISIRELKRVAADNVDLSKLPIPSINSKNKNVAVIGAGPSGLSSAYFLAIKGYNVDVYESLPEAGGMMRYGIPEHRLPRAVLNAEIENLKRYGIKIHTNVSVGKDVTISELEEKGADTIFLAVGAWKSSKLGISGENRAGVIDVISFLKDVHLKKLDKIEGKVIVLGGGHSALDGARVALRLGASEVNIVYRRARAQMPAEPEEVEEAEKEGIKIHFLAAPVSILSDNNKVSGIRCIKTRLTEPDSTGRRKPVPVEDSEFEISTDYIIPAVGQSPDLGFLGKEHGLDISKWNLLEVNPETLQTNNPKIFAGGDDVTGPATVIEAVEAGQRAAKYIDKYLCGEALPDKLIEGFPMGTNWIDFPEDTPVQKRMEIPTIAVEKRLKSFEEVNLTADNSKAQAEAERCLDCGGCCECYQCIDACKSDAVTLITHAAAEVTEMINVGSVIMSPGFKSYDPGGLDIYGYKIYDNVVTSREFERILSASGPYEGELLRPSDKTYPKKIAWLQCVGSRNIKDGFHEYCSQVCCMYAIKEAVIAKEHSKNDLDTAIFYMDMRTHGKGFEQTYNKAKNDQKVRFIRSRIHSVEPADEKGDLKLIYFTDKGELITETFSMVVLSTGLEISDEIKKLAKKADVKTDDEGFALTDCFSPVATSRSGIFACGAFSGPKDIPQSVMEASAASAASAALLSSVRNTMTSEKKYPGEIKVDNIEPRIGVFVCHCGTNIGGVVDVQAATEYAGTLPNVCYATSSLFTCSQNSQENIRLQIEKNRLNRVVVAACTPRTHEPLFRETIKEAGLNPYLFEFANIRDQNSWVHKNNPDEATKKAKDLVRMSVAKVALLEPLIPLKIDVNSNALIIGGGIAGMSAALCLADNGFKTYLLEQKDDLGGQAISSFQKTWKGDDVNKFLIDFTEKIKNHKNIELLLGTQIVEIDGFVGNFITTYKQNQKKNKIQHGAVIIATGGQPSEPDQYLYGKSKKVTKWHELVRRFEQDPLLCDKTDAVAFIQCVGSREPERPYCSKICCTCSIQDAILLKEKNPNMKVFIFYRDIRSFGQKEKLYQHARELGVIFIRFSLDERPVVEEKDDKLFITAKDHVLNRKIKIEVDYLNLASAIIPADNQNKLAQMLKVPINNEGFYMEAHMKLRPVDFSTDGIFVCGLAHYPKPVEETIAQAQAAAGRVAQLLGKQTMDIEPIVSVVDQEKCIGCGLCEMSCSFGAIRLELLTGKGFRAKNYSALCKGCGVCAASCPQQAIDMKHFSDNQIKAAIVAGGAVM